ncbi:MAG: hypothetical protein Kow00124_32550 [Anaerolineae bacterium]
MSQPKASRLAPIDALRGAAILFMIFDHCIDWWLAAPYRDLLLDRLSGFIGTLAAPIFVTLVGVGLVLSIERRRARGIPPRAVVAGLVGRGLQIIAVGYLMNLAVFFVGSNPADIFAVDVLHLIGLGLVIGIPVAWAVPAVPALLLGALWAVLSALYGGSFTLPAAPGAWVNGESGIGYFPALPWLAYVWIGVGVGRLLWRRMARRSGDPGPLAGPLLLAALICFALMLVVPNVGFRHPRLGHISLSLAVVFGLWALLDALNRAGGLAQRGVIAPLALLGEVSLMLYVFHHLIGYRMLSLFGVVTGRAWRGEYGTLTPAAALAGVALMAVLCLLVAGPWKRVRGPLEAALLGGLRRASP